MEGLIAGFRKHTWSVFGGTVPPSAWSMAKVSIRKTLEMSMAEVKSKNDVERERERERAKSRVT
jgi:hypothetical protein